MSQQEIELPYDVFFAEVAERDDTLLVFKERDNC